MNKLIENAIISIQLGVEDFNATDDRRAISSIRNITAGMLLLFKEKLRQLSPSDSNEAFVKQLIIPKMQEDSSIVHVGKGKKTADVITIKTRFNALNVKVDWIKVEKVIAVRNELEHYYSSVPSSKLRELVSNSFIVMSDFITEELNEEPAELLGRDTWRQLLEISEVYQNELNECIREKTGIEWGNEDLAEIVLLVSCNNCSSELIKPTEYVESDPGSSEFSCSSCGSIEVLSELVNAASDDHFFAESYIAATQGGEHPIGTCPDCDKEMFLIGSGECLLCGSRLEHTSCAVCHTGLSSEDQEFNGLCSYHHTQAEYAE